MNIAICHFRVGETDGVSLEIEKWKKVLLQSGHRVFLLAGNQSDQTDIYISEIQYDHPQNNQLITNAFDQLKDYANEQELLDEIEKLTKVIEEKLSQAIQEHQINYMIVENIWSLGWSFPAAIGFYRAAKKHSIKCLGHHHDFYFERVLYAQPTCPAVKDLLNKYFPPIDQLFDHAVINSLAQNNLTNQKKIPSTIVPNVFDFSLPLWAEDPYNTDFKERIGLKPGDLIILQATRVVERKAIELAIEVVGQLNKRRNELKNVISFDGYTFTERNKIVLVMPGLVESSDEYLKKLKELANENQTEILFCNDLVEEYRRQDQQNKIYSLWDSYVFADLVTYPSILEGWGNQFLEAVFAKKPIVMYEYPVYVRDIKEKGFDIISLGNHHQRSDQDLVKVEESIITCCVDQIIEVLTNQEKYHEVVNHNFKIAKQDFSYENLAVILNEIVNKNISI
ncbi:MAG: glycosyltransferase family 4 protein [Spirochaetes bacterium]|nr:glycosyltransferase family 4 protein [Spirochaetota bacterium]